MFVENWMTPDPFTVAPGTTISAAALDMARQKFRHLLVAESTAAGKKLLGLLSKYDIARAFPHDLNPFSPAVTDTTLTKPVSSIMSRNLITVAPDRPIQEAAHLLRTRHINALPVLRGNKLAGILTESDIFEALLEMTGGRTQGSSMVLQVDDLKIALTEILALSEQHRLAIQNIISYRDPRAHGKQLVVVHCDMPPGNRFVQDLCRHGARLVSLK